MGLLPPEPPRLNIPEDPVLVNWTLPKRLPVALVLLDRDAVPADVTDVEAASPAFPNVRAAPKLKPEGTVDTLAVCVTAALVVGALLVVLALSST